MYETNYDEFDYETVIQSDNNCGYFFIDIEERILTNLSMIIKHDDYYDLCNTCSIHNNIQNMPNLYKFFRSKYLDLIVGYNILANSALDLTINEYFSKRKIKNTSEYIEIPLTFFDCINNNQKFGFPLYSFDNFRKNKRIWIHIDCQSIFSTDYLKIAIKYRKHKIKYDLPWNYKCIEKYIYSTDNFLSNVDNVLRYENYEEIKGFIEKLMNCDLVYYKKIKNYIFFKLPDNEEINYTLEYRNIRYKIVYYNNKNWKNLIN